MRQLDGVFNDSEGSASMPKFRIPSELRSTLLALLAAIACAPAAEAAISVSPGLVVGTGANENVSVGLDDTEDPEYPPPWRVRTKHGGLTASGGCRVDDDDPTIASCPREISQWEVRLEGGDDDASVGFSRDAAFPVQFTVLGGPGADYLFGSAGNDVIDGGPGDDCNLWGGAGDDIVRGGEGNDGKCRVDRFSGAVPGIAGEQGRDQLDGGPGADRMISADSALEETFDGNDNLISRFADARDVVVCADGKDDLYHADPLDSISGDCENRKCQVHRTLTRRADRFAGTIRGDYVFGLGRADNIRGGRGGDCLEGGGGNDTLDGGGGNDDLVGGAGSNKLRGGAGDDFLQGAGRVYGGSGRDKIQAENGLVDVVNCGSGRDAAGYDGFDRVRNCERRIR